MSMDTHDLKMVNKTSPEVEKCPKCYAEYPLNRAECPNCGVVFKKIKPPVDADRSIRPGITPQFTTTDHHKTHYKSDNFKKIATRIAAVGLFFMGFSFIYFSYIEGRLNAGAFESQMDEFCNASISESHVDHVAQGDEPFRTGRVLLVSPGWSVTMHNAKTGRPYTMSEPPKIHPAWFKLSRNIRAKNPEGIDTLIRLSKELGTTGRYGKMKTRVFTTHKIIMDVYDWPGQTFIGTKVIDPGEGSVFMTEKDYDAMVQAMSDKEIAKYIQSMDIYE